VEIRRMKKVRRRKSQSCKVLDIEGYSLKAIWPDAATQKNGNLYRGKVTNEKLRYRGNVEIGN